MFTKTIWNALSFFIFCSILIPHTIQAQWEWSNPQPSGYWAIDMIFTDANHGFILNDRGVLGTTDGGTSWEIIQELETARDFDIQGNIGFVVGKWRAYKSTDAGNTWRPVSIPGLIELLYVKVISSDVVYMLSDSNLYKSSDGGDTWDIKSIPSHNIESAFFQTALIGFAGDYDGTIWKTTDGGDSWSITYETGLGPADVHFIQFINELVGFASRGHSDLLKTIDGGNTWYTVEAPGERSNCLFPIGDQRLYIGGRYGQLYFSTDQGETWVKRPNNDYYSGTHLYALHFFDELRGIATGGKGRILSTQDGGFSWDEYSPTYWTILDLQFINSSLGYACTRNEVLRTDDEGDSWTVLFQNTDQDYNIHGIHFVNEQLGFLYGEDRIIQRTTNGGTTWANASTPNLPSLNELTDMFFLSDQVGIAVDRDVLIRTTNAGQTWTTIFDDDYRAYSFPSAEVGYISGGFGSTKFLKKTINGGVSWTDLTPRQFSVLHFTTPLEGVGYSFEERAILRTEDGGQSWEIVFEIDDYFETFLEFSNGILVLKDGTAREFVKSNDRGKTWKLIPVSYDFGSIYDLHFVNENIGLAVDDRGNYLQTSTGGLSWEATNLRQCFGVEFTSNEQIFLRGKEGVILKNNLSFAPYTIWSNDTHYDSITHRSAILEGLVAANDDTIKNIRFEILGRSPAYVTAEPAYILPGTSSEVRALADGLDPDETYEFRLLVEHQGEIDQTDLKSFTTYPAVEVALNPVSPQGNSAILYANLLTRETPIVDLVWEYGVDNRYDKTQTANITYVDGPGELYLIDTLKSLQQETTYQVRLRMNYGGEVLYSNSRQFKTKRAFELEMYQPLVGDADLTNLAGKVVANTDTIKEIVFEYGPAISFSNLVAGNPDLIASPGNQIIEASIQGLVPDQVYAFRVRGIMAGDTIRSSFQLFRPDGQPVLLLQEPEWLSAASVRFNAWVADGGSYIYDLNFEYGIADDYGNSLAASRYSVGGFQTLQINSPIVNNLSRGKTYYYRLRGTTNSSGSENLFSEPRTFTTLPLNIVNQEVLTTVLMFPNPTTGELRSPYSLEAYRVEVYDLVGRNLATYQNLEYDLNLSHLGQGTYFLKFKTKGQLDQVQRIVIIP